MLQSQLALANRSHVLSALILRYVDIIGKRKSSGRPLFIHTVFNIPEKLSAGGIGIL